MAERSKEELLELREAARAQWLSLDRILGILLGIPEGVEDDAVVCPTCGADEDQLENTTDFNQPTRYTCLACGKSCGIKESRDGLKENEDG